MILVVCSGDYTVHNPASGIWVYRDWDSDNASPGGLRVFDWYADTKDYDTMKAKQLERFDNYKGYCQQDPNLPCDLFLLSWTLTPATDVLGHCKDANRNLGAVMAQLTVPNRFGCVPNLLYVDYVELARVTDVALFQNGLA